MPLHSTRNSDKPANPPAQRPAEKPPPKPEIDSDVHPQRRPGDPHCQTSQTTFRAMKTTQLWFRPVTFTKTCDAHRQQVFLSVRPVFLQGVMNLSSTVNAKVIQAT
ncbi:hypothetical protein L1889_04495 [Paenalcaligenes niemegkensis]|uniref:hypothetical protein n=1 Tax=Paenalcaligenes niemegkensis TaxID=2895469 RepID=UPI001EE852C7|nr:hypothetical protein [Paenalcaligenes niemegkensis]MCQ9616053.1 hypothetical protein [Paenalcaligenes niemegkensis]